MALKLKKKANWFESNGKDLLELAGLLLACLTIIATFMFPLIVAIWKDNYWLTLLFLVSWIPTVFEIILLKAFIK
jgi:hypothetical protein